MFDYPDGNVAQPVIAALDSAGTAAANLALGADVYFWQIKIIGAEADSVVLWRPAISATDTAPLEAASSYSVAVGDGEAYETSLLPATQRPPTVRALCTAGSARVEVLRVVRQSA